MQNATISFDELRQSLQAERAARAEAERANRLKDEFLLLVSHELRTPLTAVLGWSRLLKHQASGELLESGLAAIEHNAQAQSRLIEDLLDVGQIMGGNVALNLQPVRLAFVLDAVIHSMRPAASAKQITLENLFDSTVPPVLADAPRLEQVFRNLISNGIKFTPAGGKLKVRLHVAEGTAVITVTDNGCGMDPSFVGKVFNRFYQADDPYVRRNGLGLGLWIVKQIVDLHGGTVTAKSAGRGAGSTFAVILPLLISAQWARGDLMAGAQAAATQPD